MASLCFQLTHSTKEQKSLILKKKKSTSFAFFVPFVLATCAWFSHDLSHVDAAEHLYADDTTIYNTARSSYEALKKLWDAFITSQINK